MARKKKRKVYVRHVLNEGLDFGWCFFCEGCGRRLISERKLMLECPVCSQKKEYSISSLIYSVSGIRPVCESVVVFCCGEKESTHHIFVTADTDSNPVIVRIKCVCGIVHLFGVKIIMRSKKHDRKDKRRIKMKHDKSS